MDIVGPSRNGWNEARRWQEGRPLGNSIVGTQQSRIQGSNGPWVTKVNGGSCCSRRLRLRPLFLFLWLFRCMSGSQKGC
eukprot:scaffold68321_cov41-Attheya_sp.AAC.2